MALQSVLIFLIQFHNWYVNADWLRGHEQFIDQINRSVWDNYEAIVDIFN